MARILSSTDAAISAWLSRSIERLEALPANEDRDRTIRILRGQLEAQQAPRRLLDPHTIDDWLDRRAALEADERRARFEAAALECLRKHHPRFGGKEAR